MGPATKVEQHRAEALVAQRQGPTDLKGRRQRGVEHTPRWVVNQRGVAGEEGVRSRERRGEERSQRAAIPGEGLGADAGVVGQRHEAVLHAIAGRPGGVAVCAERRQRSPQPQVLGAEVASLIELGGDQVVDEPAKVLGGVGHRREGPARQRQDLDLGGAREIGALVEVGLEALERDQVDDAGRGRILGSGRARGEAVGDHDREEAGLVEAEDRLVAGVDLPAVGQEAQLVEARRDAGEGVGGDLDVAAGLGVRVDVGLDLVGDVGLEHASRRRQEVGQGGAGQPSHGAGGANQLVGAEHQERQPWLVVRHRALPGEHGIAEHDVGQDLAILATGVVGRVLADDRVAVDVNLRRADDEVLRGRQRRAVDGHAILLNGVIDLDAPVAGLERGHVAVVELDVADRDVS